MDFDWMNVELPREILVRNAERRREAAFAAVRLQAGLLRRLGYDAAYATHRLLGNQRWAHELGTGGQALDEDQLRAAVGQAYAR